MVVNSNVHSKSDIIIGLNDVYDRLITFCNNQDDSMFAKPLAEGKWSTAQNIEHLCTSTYLMTKGISMPKLVMKASFGTCNRPEKTIDEVYAKYKTALANGQKAPPKFDPAVVGNEMKTELMKKIDNERNKIIAVMDKWDEKALSKHILPHPALGKLTVREMLLFTIFHTEHHLETIKKITA